MNAMTYLQELLRINFLGGTYIHTHTHINMMTKCSLGQVKVMEKGRSKSNNISLELLLCYLPLNQLNKLDSKDWTNEQACLGILCVGFFYMRFLSNTQMSLIMKNQL